MPIGRRWGNPGSRYTPTRIPESLPPGMRPHESLPDLPSRRYTYIRTADAETGHSLSVWRDPDEPSLAVAPCLKCEKAAEAAELGRG